MSVRLIQLLSLLVAAALFRLLFYEAYLPWWAGDSSGYAALAALYSHHLLGLWDGGRTPAYPLFLYGCECLAGGEMKDKLTPHAGQIVVGAQTLLGLASVVLVFFTMERLQVRSSLRIIFTLIYALLAPVAQFEMIILSESLSLFCLLLSVYLLAVVMDRLRKRRPAAGMALLAGLAAGLSVLARPNLVFIWGLFFTTLPLLGCLGYLRRLDTPPWAAWLTTVVQCAGGGALVILACMIFNYWNTNNFALTPMTGLTRSFAVYNLFDRVHPQDRVLGAIMDKYYRQANPHGERKRDYIWQAIPEIWAHYQEMPVQQDPGRLHTVYLDNYLGTISNYLMRENRGVWLRNSMEQLPTTFDFDLPQTTPEDKGGDPISLSGTSVVRDVNAWRATVVIARWEAPLLLGTYLLTFAAVVIGAVQIWRARCLSTALLALFSFNLALGSVLSMVVFCMLAAYYNRYSLPLFPEFIICSAYVLETLVGIFSGFSHRNSSSRRSVRLAEVLSGNSGPSKNASST